MRVPPIVIAMLDDAIDRWPADAETIAAIEWAIETLDLPPAVETLWRAILSRCEYDLAAVAPQQPGPRHGRREP